MHGSEDAILQDPLVREEALWERWPFVAGVGCSQRWREVRCLGGDGISPPFCGYVSVCKSPPFYQSENIATVSTVFERFVRASISHPFRS